MIAIRMVVICSLLLIVTGCGSSDDLVSAPTSQEDLQAPDLSSTASPRDVCWNFDEGVGNVLNDVTGNGNDGTVFGATWVTGYSGNALQFDGQNDYVATSFAPIVDQDDSFILEFAFKDLSPVSTQEYVFGLERTNGQEISFMISGSSRIGLFRFRDDSHNFTDIQTPALNADQWYLIRIERRVSADQVLFYIDNVLVATTEDLTQTNVNAVATRTLELGSDNNSTFPHRGPFSGVLDEMCFTFDTGFFSLDIKPGSCPNPINPKSKGKLPVAILGTAEFDVLDIDVSSLLLEGVAPIRSSIEDVSAPVDTGDECDCTEEGPDSYDDLTLKFSTQEIVAAIGPVSPGDEKVFTITGTLLDGTPFEASDCVVVVGGKKDRKNEWIVFARENDVWRVQPDGSDIERVVDLPAGAQPRGIALSPDASRLAYLEYYSEFSTSNRLVLVDIDGSNPQTLVPTGSNGASGVCDFHPDGT
ncbi:hypothetical protein KAR91_33610, partial [Candidatus Pacearchaeota archaeon]|nr:hypothetical protein [Candidatus Pacearchaeota archaeon]